MAKNKLKDSFYWLGKNGQENTVDMLDKQIVNSVKQVKDCLKHTPTDQSNFMYIAAKEALVVGLVDEEGSRVIFVARDYYEADYLPECGWMKVDNDGVN